MPLRPALEALSPANLLTVLLAGGCCAARPKAHPPAAAICRLSLRHMVPLRRPVRRGHILTRLNTSWTHVIFQWRPSLSAVYQQLSRLCFVWSCTDGREYCVPARHTCLTCRSCSAAGPAGGARQRAAAAAHAGGRGAGHAAVALQVGRHRVPRPLWSVPVHGPSCMPSGSLDAVAPLSPNPDCLDEQQTFSGTNCSPTAWRAAPRPSSFTAVLTLMRQKAAPCCPGSCAAGTPTCTCRWCQRR